MFKKSLPVLFVVGLVVLAFPLMVAARGGQPPADAPLYGADSSVTNGSAWRGGGQRGGWLTGGVSLVDATAQATGMAVEDVVAALQSGQTYADLAGEAGVTLQDIVDVVISVRADALAQAVVDGRFTQEQADLMLATMAEDLLARLNEPWTSQGAGNGYMLDGTQPSDGTGYRGGNARGMGQRGTMANRSMLNSEECPYTQ